MKQTSFSLLKALAVAILTMGAVAVANAQDAKVDPTGTWTWAMAGRNGNPGRTNTLTLSYQNSAVTGTLKFPGRGGEITSTDITDGKLAGDKLSFKVSREYNGNTYTAEYAGTVTTDSIKGKITTERDGEKHSRNWEAKKAAATTP